MEKPVLMPFWRNGWCAVCGEELRASQWTQRPDFCEACAAAYGAQLAPLGYTGTAFAQARGARQRRLTEK